MRTSVYPLLLSVLLLATGTTSAAPAPEEDSKVPAYLKALESKDPLVRKQVALTLGDLGAKARSAMPALRKALLDPDEGVQRAAAAALEKISGAGKPAESDDEQKKLTALLRAEEAALRAKMEELARFARLAADKEKELRVEAEKMKANLRDQVVAVEIKLRSLQERNVQLLETIEKLTKEIARLRKDAVPERPAPGKDNPPAENLEGTVKRTDKASGLTTITIGSDAGLQKGHTLEVFRLKPVSKYLGRVKVIEVTAKEAVCQPIGKLHDTLEPGDNVASRIPAK